MSVVIYLLLIASAKIVREIHIQRCIALLGFDQTPCFNTMFCAGRDFAAVVVEVGVRGCEHFSHCPQTGSALREVCVCERCE